MIRIGCDAICVQLFVELRKHGQTEYQIYPTIGFTDWSLSQCHTWCLHTCMAVALHLRDRKGEMRRTVIICFVCPNVPLIGSGWMMFERICLWRNSSSHLFFACLDTVHCQDHFVFLLHVYCIAWKITMLHSKAVTVWKCPFECCPSWSKHDLSLVLHKNGSGSWAAHSDFRLYAADGALCSWAKPTWWGHRGNR